jgi:hypothetical protein
MDGNRNSKHLIRLETFRYMEPDENWKGQGRGEGRSS